MKLSAESRKKQKSILDNLKKNIPLAGLLAGAAVMTGCHPKENNPGAVMGKMTLDDNVTNTTETTDGELIIDGDIVETMGELPEPEDETPPPPMGTPASADEAKSEPAGSEPEKQ